MNIKLITTWFVLIVIAVMVIYDIFAFSQAGTHGTISWTIYEWSHEYPAFSFLMGFVMGHLFWQMKNKPLTKGKNDV